MVKNNMVDNNTYNVLQAFVSTLEALEAYQKYSQDGNEQLWQQVSQHTEQVARILQQHLPQALQQAQGSQGAMYSRGQGAMAGQGSSTMAGQGQSQETMGQSGNYGTSQSSDYGTGQSGNYGTTGGYDSTQGQQRR